MGQVDILPSVSGLKGKYDESILRSRRLYLDTNSGGDRDELSKDLPRRDTVLMMTNCINHCGEAAWTSGASLGGCS